MKNFTDAVSSICRYFFELYLYLDDSVCSLIEKNSLVSTLYLQFWVIVSIQETEAAGLSF